MYISRLHYISHEVKGKTHPDLIEDACKAGVDWVQLRVKDRSYEETLSIARQVKEICDKYKVRFIVNDYVSIAKEIKADGVHLGKNDMHPLKAREMMGEGFLIGGTANSFEDLQALALAKADYIGLGPFRFTTTKENLSPLIGLEGYLKLLSQCKKENINIPVIAIGGILPEDLTDLMKMGIYGVAVSSVINRADNKKQVVELMNSRILEFIIHKF